jgi:hypothetical protein
MKKVWFFFGCRSIISLFLPLSIMAQNDKSFNTLLAREILTNASLGKVDSMGRELLTKPFNAGDGYSQVWIRDLNTFMEIAMEVRSTGEIKTALKTFLEFQQANNEVVDCYGPKEKKWGDTGLYYSTCNSKYVGFKATVETDQETSLIQAVTKYVRKTKDFAFLSEKICGVTVIEHLRKAISYLMKERYNTKYGLLWGAMTADWGDVQPSTKSVTDIDSSTTPAIDVYDNAMMIIALKDLSELIPDKREAGYYIELQNRFARNVRKFLWNSKKQQFIPHIYINRSPLPKGFDENEVFYHGGTAVAIEAGILSKKEIVSVNKHMLLDVELSGAPSIGLTLYPVYPQNFFHGGMANAYVYQNGGDWHWFGGRMIQQLVVNGFISDAYHELQPMIQKILEYNSFYEWYNVKGEPKGSNNFKGSAGVICKAIQMLRNWAMSQEIN